MTVTAYFVPCSQEFTSEDGLVSMTIPEGTTALDISGDPITEVHLAIDEAPPAPPEEARFIGPVYRLEPDGVAFDLPMGVNWSYDSAIPEEVSEETLVIAYYEETASEWVALSSIAETEANQVAASAPAEHLSALALLGYPPPKEATFSLRPLTVYPEVLTTGEMTFIATQIANTGEVEGSHTVTFKVNGVAESAKEMALDGGTEAGVVFSYSPTAPGSYQVEVDGLTSSFTVTEPPPPPAVITPEPPQTTPAPTTTATDPWYLSWPMAVIAATLTLAIAVPLNWRAARPDRGREKTGTPTQKS
jgi:hypothetical protein